jgi:putative oxidoreductase
MTQATAKLTHILALIGDRLQPVLLLLIRLYWGWQFFQTGKGKLMDIPTFVDRFRDWGVPMPHLSVILAGATECVGGLLLLLGLRSRIVALPLMFTMTVAYLTAERAALRGIFSDPDTFVSATPFLFFFAAVIVFVFGPGRYSLDALLAKKSASAPRSRA